MIRTMAKVSSGMAGPQGVLARARRRLAGGDGQALIEFALVLPLILLIILGIIDFGRAFNYYNDETSLANQAARFATVNACGPCSGTPIEDYVKSTADTGELRFGSGGTFGVAQPGATVSFCLPAGSAGKQGDAIRAKVTSGYRWLPFFHFADVNITSTVTARLDQPYDFAVTSNNKYANGATAGSPAPLAAC